MYKMMYKIEDDAGPARSRYNGNLLAKFSFRSSATRTGNRSGAFHG